MIKMKRFFVGLAIGLILAVAPAFAAPGAIGLIVNGQKITTDVEPVMINGRVMVPARLIAEPLGAAVEWDEKTKTVNIILGKWEKVWPTWEERTGKRLMTYLGMKDSTPLESLQSGIQVKFTSIKDNTVFLMRINDKLYIKEFD